MKYLLLLPLFVASLAAHAQNNPARDSLKPLDPRWRRTLKTSLGLNEALISSNWRGGGTNTLGFNASFNAKANRQAGKNSFDNEADFLFAFSQTKGLGYRKSQDRLYLDTKVGHEMSEHWNMFGSLNLLTQFAPGYKYGTDATAGPTAQLISDLFAPGFVTAAYGFEYHTKNSFKVRLAPFAPRLTVVNQVERFITADNPTPYGVDPGHSTRFEVLAAQVLAELDKTISPNFNVKARYLLFANYRTLELKKIDHRLDVGITAKVARFVDVSLNGIALYDYDQDNDIQFSQGLTIGLGYTVQNFRVPPKK